MDKIEIKILEWYDLKWNAPIFPFFWKKPKIDLETSLSTGKIIWDIEDAEDIMEDYFSRFDVNPHDFSFSVYWPSNPFAKPAPKALTLSMLAESAKAGYWLYD